MVRDITLFLLVVIIIMRSSVDFKDFFIYYLVGIIIILVYWSVLELEDD